LKKQLNLMEVIRLFENTKTESKIYFKRPRLHHQLKQSLQKPLTTIVAGPGYGKTQTVYEVLQENEDMPIWLQLSQFDNLNIRFWENFVYAISLADEKSASVFKREGFPETIQEYSRFLVLLSNTMKADKKYILVCDDFHLIHKRNILDFFKKLIEAHIPNLSIIIISRTEPDFNFIMLYSKDMISIIDEDNLRFTKEEMIHYFELLNIAPSTKAISDIYLYTDGWIFAIRLVGLSLSKGIRNEDYAILTMEQNIFELIESEVFSVISKDLQILLIKLSLIDTLPLDLLIVLSSYNMDVVSEVNELNSFIRYDTFLKTYRIHHLFLDFLIDKQFVLSNEEKIDVYNKSADWYVKNGYAMDALTYYEKAGEYNKMLEIISTFYAACPKETAQFLLDIFDRMPKAIYEEKPFTQVMHAKFVLNSFRFEDSYKEILRVIKKYERLPQSEENRMILGESYIILGITDFVRCAYTGEYAFREYYKLADGYLPNGSTLINKNNFTYNSGGYSCVMGSSFTGEFDKFIDVVCDYAPYATRVTNGSGSGTEYLCLTEKSYFQMSLKDVKKYASLTIEEAKKQDQSNTICMAIFYMVRANIALGNYESIISLLEQLRFVCEKYGTPKSYKILELTESWFYIQIKQPDKVAAWIKGDIANLNRETIPINYMFGRLAQAKYYLSEQKYDDLLTHLDKEDELYGPNLYLLGTLDNKVLKAVALYQTKETKKAIATLQEIYDLAVPDSLYMPLIEIGSKMRTLTKAAMKDEDCTIPDEWLEMISTKSSTYAKRVSKIMTEYRIANSENDTHPNLTMRELELLTDLSHGLSREEIASDLNLSINTVKHMLQNVFNKLGAENTIDAVRIAIAMKLVK